SRQVHARSEKYGFEKIIKAETGDWGFPGTALKSVHTTTGYHYERGGGPHKVLFIGDSHAEQYYPRIDKLFLEHPDRSKGIMFVTQRGCLPIAELKGITYPKCKGFAENARAMAERADVETIVMVAAWNRYEDILGSKDGEKAFQDLAVSLGAFK